MTKLAVTIDQARQAATSRLHSISDTARLDAEIILSEAVSVDRNMLNLIRDDTLNSDQQNDFETLLSRRMAGEPIAYITGSKEFWSLDLRVSDATLVPRPETELVVERTLFHCNQLDAPYIADLGTGCGAIALALASELAESDITATDISQDALSIAKMNCERLNISNVRFVQGNWTDALEGMRFDIIASNPPYIREDDQCLKDIFMLHEPKLALTGGDDGFSAIRRIVDGSSKFLNPGGWLIIEHGFDQPDAVQNLMSNNGFVEVRTYSDLAGLPRVTEGMLIATSKN